MNTRVFAVVNPAAGGGRCGKLAPAALDRVRRLGIELEVVETTRAGDGVALAHDAYARGFRNFLAVGGDGTAYEIVNGVFPAALAEGRPALGFLPLGTGNSFLRDFTERGVEHTIEVLRTGKKRSCDVILLHHAQGDIYFINTMNLGFAADAGEVANRRFKRWGELGYIFGVLTKLVRLEHTAFPHRLDQSPQWDRRPCLFLAFGNSKFTGGKMMIAPHADPTDGMIEYIRWSPIGRLRLLWTFPRLFTGTHIDHPLADRAGAKRVDFDLAGPVNVIIDGEVLQLDCRAIEILPGALEIFA